MTFDEQLAAAMVAKLAGSTLKEVDQYTVQQSSNGPATRINPQDFLVGVKQIQQQKQARIIEEQNRLAEQLYPLPEPTPVQPQPVQPVQTSAVSQTLVDTDIKNAILSIDKSLKTIAESVLEWIKK
jgi:hypothetical protein